MHARLAILLQSSSLIMLAACATGGPDDGMQDTQADAMSVELGCGPNQIAVCVDNICEPEDYVCAERDGLRDMFRPRRSRKNR